MGRMSVSETILAPKAAIISLALNEHWVENAKSSFGSQVSLISFLILNLDNLLKWYKMCLVL